MSKVNIKPLADRVLIEPASAEEKQLEVLLFLTLPKKKPQKGTIVAVGPGTTDQKMTVKVGDTVIYGKYSGTEISYEGKDYLIMKESDLYAII